MESPDSVNLLQLSQDLLRYRNFSSSRRYAFQALLSQPNLRWPHQILAVLQVLISADHPLTPSLPDWYSILQLHPLARNIQLIQEHFDKLSSLLNPLTNHFPFSQDAFSLVRDAWSLLSSPDKKALYDRQLAQHSSQMKEGHGDTDTFWSLCPYCYCLYQYYRIYEDCCLRCQSCARAFQAVMIPSPPKPVEGTGHYYCFGVFPLGFSGIADECNNDFVDISDDTGESSRGKKKENAVNLDAEKPKEEEMEKGDDRAGENIQTGDEDGEIGVKEKGGLMNVEMTKPEGDKVKTSEDDDGFLTPDVNKISMKKKSVAKNTKKLMGTGRLGRRRQNVIYAMRTGTPDCNVGEGCGVEDGGAGLIGGLESGSSGASVFTERGTYEEHDDILLSVPISWDGWNEDFKSF